MRCFLLILFLLISISCLYSQNIENRWEQYVELLTENLENEEDISEVIEMYNYYVIFPINLNVNSSELLQLGFITEFQVNALKTYILQNGYLLSFFELQFINGFSCEIIQLISPFAYVGEVIKKEKFQFSDILKYGKHNISLGGKRIIEKQKGFTKLTEKEIESGTGMRYLGSPYREYFKYQYNAKNRILFGIAGEKDAGEEFSFRKKPYGFDYYGIYLMAKDIGIIDKAIIGNYHLQFGQGLTLWTGLGFSIASGAAIKKQPQGIKQASSFSEYGQMEGFATTIKLFKGLKFSLFYSSKDRDAVILDVNEDDKVTEFQSFIKTGYHRTKKELETRNAINENIFGSNLHYSFRNASVGFTAYGTKLSAKWNPVNKPYNYYVFRGNENLNTGIDFHYLYKQMNLFGEIALDKEQNFASILGMQTYFSSNTFFSSYYRYYSPQYFSLYSSAFGQNSNNSNEQGFFFIFQTILPFHIKTIASADIFSFPWLKYQVNNPSTFGSEFRLNFTKDIQRNINLSLQYRFKEKPYNLNEDTIYIRYTEQTFKQGLQLRLNVDISEEWSFDSRAEYSYYHSESKPKTYGFLIAQDIGYSPKKFPLHFAVRYALFDTEQWDNRIYAYEKDLEYEFSVPAYSGKGSRFYILMRWDVTSKMNLGLRYSLWYYPYKEMIGSGLDEIQGNRKQEVKLSMRMVL